MDATLLLPVDHLGPPRKTLPLQQEGGSKKQSLGVGVCEPLTLRAVKVGAWPQRDLPTAPLVQACASVCARVASCPERAHVVHMCLCVLVRVCTRVHACARVCLCVGAARADGLTKLLEPI